MRAARASAGDVVVVSLFVNPTQFGPSRGPRRLPARRGARRRARRARPGADVLFAPARRGGLPDGFATTVHVAGVTEPLEGAHAARALRRRRDRRGEAAQHGRARRRLLRPEGRPAGAGRSAASCATSTCRCGSRSARPSASRTASRCRAATSAWTRTSASAPSRCAARSTPPSRPSPPASATPRRVAAAARAAMSRRRRARVPRARRPGDLRARRRTRRRDLVAVAARVGRRPTHRQHDLHVQAPRARPGRP